MAIFGVGNIRIVNDSTSAFLSISRSDIIGFNPKFDKSDILIHTSILTGKRSTILKGKYQEFDLTILGILEENYLFFAGLVGIETTVYPSDDFFDDQPALISFKCLCTKAEPFYWKEISFHDAIKIKLISTDYVDLPALMTEDGT